MAVGSSALLGRFALISDVNGLRNQTFVDAAARRGLIAMGFNPNIIRA
jgi:hypothetical protein